MDWTWLRLGAGITSGGLLGGFIVGLPASLVFTLISNQWTEAVCVPPGILDAGGIAVYDLGCNDGYYAGSFAAVLLVAVIGFGFGARWAFMRMTASEAQNRPL